jgi:hypothetical protein
MPRPRRSLSIIGLVAVGALLLGACSSDDDASSKKTTTTASSKAKQTTTTISKAEWDAALSTARTQIGGAKGDVCALWAASQESLPSPSNAAQGKDAIELVTELLDEIADAAPAANAKEAATIRATADKVRAEGAEAHYSGKFLAGPQALKDPDFGAAMQTFQTMASSQCQSSTPTTAAP